MHMLELSGRRQKVRGRAYYVPAYLCSLTLYTVSRPFSTIAVDRRPDETLFNQADCRLYSRVRYTMH